MLQHMTLCGTLYEHMVTPMAGTAVRTVYVEAMCADATRDLLCSSLEKGLAQGTLLYELRMHVLIECWQQLLCALSS